MDGVQAAALAPLECGQCLSAVASEAQPIVRRFVEESTVFTDGNASMGDTRFFSDENDLDHIDRDALCALWWNGDANEELRRRKAAEVLVWKHVPPERIIDICAKTPA
jgi:hypothetical protein